MKQRKKKGKTRNNDPAGNPHYAAPQCVTEFRRACVPLPTRRQTTRRRQKVSEAVLLVWHRGAERLTLLVSPVVGWGAIWFHPPLTRCNSKQQRQLRLRWELWTRWRQQELVGKRLGISPIARSSPFKFSLDGTADTERSQFRRKAKKQKRNNNERKNPPRFNV